MPYASLRDFIARLEQAGRLVRVKAPVSPHLEMTEIQTRLLAEHGPAVLFENVTHDRSRMPVLVNLFGTVERVAWGMGREPQELRALGEQLAWLKQPEPPGGWREAFEMFPLLKTVMAMKPKTVSNAPCQEVVLKGDDVDLTRVEKAVGRKKTPARIGQRPRQIAQPGQKAPAPGAEETFEFRGKLAQSPFSIVRCRPLQPAKVARSPSECPIDPCAISSTVSRRMASLSASANR